jgi:hypothetical protein
MQVIFWYLVTCHCFISLTRDLTFDKRLSAYPIRKGGAAMMIGLVLKSTPDSSIYAQTPPPSTLKYKSVSSATSALVIMMPAMVLVLKVMTIFIRVTLRILLMTIDLAHKCVPIPISMILLAKLKLPLLSSHLSEHPSLHFNTSLTTS